MVIDTVTIELCRTGEKATLLCQGRPLGVVMKITLEELEALATYYAQEAWAWRVAHEQNSYRILGLTRTVSARRSNKPIGDWSASTIPTGRLATKIS
ncbi:MAG TPA: hypothetical protein VK901_18640 [Nitrospiraceae bacterium]|nr:hypothetical protein [Nitrospiraceae bacterium]